MEKNKPTRILSDEHKKILTVIDALLAECDALESGKAVDERFLKRVIGFVRDYADRFHHAKEEDILFVELCKDAVQMRCNPTRQMLYEHDLGRGFVKGIGEGLEEGDKGKIIKNSRGYAELLKEHIFKEDSILYPMADEALGKEAQGRMLEKFRETEKKFRQKNEDALMFVKEIEEKEIKNGRRKREP